MLEIPADAEFRHPTKIISMKVLTQLFKFGAKSDWKNFMINVEDVIRISGLNSTQIKSGSEELKRLNFISVESRPPEWSHKPRRFFTVNIKKIMESIVRNEIQVVINDA